MTDKLKNFKEVYGISDSLLEAANKVGSKIELEEAMSLDKVDKASLKKCTKEDVEPLEEVSKDKLKSYLDQGGKTEGGITLAINKLRKLNKAKEFINDKGYIDARSAPKIAASGKKTTPKRKPLPFRVWD